MPSIFERHPPNASNDSPTNTTPTASASRSSSSSSSNATTTAAGTSNPANCRTCSDFKSWSAAMHGSTARQASTLHSPGSTTSNVATATSTSHIANASSDNDAAAATPQPQRVQCPYDKDELGNSTWGLLHTMAAHYPQKPTVAESKDMSTFLTILSKFYPCEVCATDFQKELIVEPVNASSQTALSQWLCRLHNKVNVKLGKPVFDCATVNQRWRDGWADGSCD